MAISGVVVSVSVVSVTVETEDLY